VLEVLRSRSCRTNYSDVILLVYPATAGMSLVNINTWSVMSNSTHIDVGRYGMQCLCNHLKNALPIAMQWIRRLCLKRSQINI
jgi:hypothetical protein